MKLMIKEIVCPPSDTSTKTVVMLRSHMQKPEKWCVSVPVSIHLSLTN